MPALAGSDKSVGWAQRCRHGVMAAGYACHVLAGGLTEQDWAGRFEAAARNITAASWWIDNRDTDPDDLSELLVAANRHRSTHAALNPH
jgi:hypothetical protein